ncbi:MAG TPA: hypothetical protein DCE14_08675, partial [Kosmotogaceae bacterium]|nr:hypothetical protein [Kosmotogaceae bacterium]
MEKAKVQLREAKKGVTGTLLFENGKSMPIPKHFGLPLSENNKEAEVERNEKGQLTKIVIEGRVYRESQRAQSTRAHDVTSSHQRFPKRVPRQGPEEHSKEAHAPYNFVPLNESIVPAERNEIPPFDRYSTDLLSGYLEIDIDVKTPLYVRRKARDARFFEINGEPIIPGSSIRGMIRTLLEIASYSRMIFVDDSRYYFRSFADKCIPLRQLYNDTIGTETEGKVEAGFLRYESKTQDFYIVKAESPDRFADTQREFDYAFEDNSWKVWTGRLGKKKKKNWIFQAPDDDTEEALTEEDRILLTQEDVEDYQNDRTRRIPVDLLESAKIGTLVKDGKPQKPEFR